MTNVTHRPASYTPGARKVPPVMDLGVLRRWWPIVAVAALLAVASLAAAHSVLGASRIPPAVDTVPWVPEYPSAQPSPSYPVEPRDGARATRATIPDWIATVAVVLLALGILVVLGYVIWTVVGGVVRRRIRTPSVERARRSTGGTTRDVVAALDAGLIDLDDRDTDARIAVIACWVRLEEAAAAAGVPRRAGDTPTDLVIRLLHGDETAGVPAIVSTDVLAAFAHVYREARYATRAVDEPTRDHARAALRRLRGELTAEVVAADGVMERHIAEAGR